MSMSWGVAKESETCSMQCWSLGLSAATACGGPHYANRARSSEGRQLCLNSFASSIFRGTRQGFGRPLGSMANRQSCAPHPLKEVDRLTREVQITARTLGVALISLQLDEDKRTGWLWVELFLSETEPA